MLFPSASITFVLTPWKLPATGSQTDEVPTGQRGGGRGLRRQNKAEPGKKDAEEGEEKRRQTPDV